MAGKIAEFLRDIFHLNYPTDNNYSPKLYVNAANSGEDCADQQDKTIDFSTTYSVADLANTKPVACNYFGKTVDGFSTWAGLYAAFFSYLYPDYSHLLKPGMSFSRSTGRIELCDATLSGKMLAPKPIHGTSLYLETNFSAKHIVDKIRFLLDLCQIDYENVIIKYQRKYEKYKQAHMPIVNMNASDLRSDSTTVASADASAVSTHPAPYPTDVKVQDDWIKYDSTNSQDFERTKPVYCSVAGIPVVGKNWARILVGISERELEKRNPAMDQLYKESFIATSRPYLMKEPIKRLNCAHLSNGYWICINYSIPKLMKMIWTFCLKCGYKDKDIILYGVKKDTASATRKRKTVPTSTENGISLEKAEDYLRSVGLHGSTVKELIEAVQPGAAIHPTEFALESSINVVSMPESRYVHIDSFSDINDARKVLGEILKTHFASFDGYSNNSLLFNAASQELPMFLNDNDCENIDAVYAIATFLFEKKTMAGKPYKFSKPHIFDTEPDHPMTPKGLMIHIARSNGGLLYETDAKDYLLKTMIPYRSIRNLLQIGSSNAFLMYDSNRYILSESIGIDDAWCMQMHDRLDDLFRKANVAYIIPRDINIAWLTTLPLLPHNLGWTCLLLQEVLDKYPAIGFKSISPDLNQTHDTLAAAFVPIDSPLQTFADVVTLFMEEHHDLPMRMPGEDLRLELRDAGMLENREMIYALPKALNDYRFAWSNENKTVYVRGNK